MIFGFNNNKCKHEVYSKEQIDTLLKGLQKEIYPVGSIYMSVTNTNPSNFFGGEWIEWGAGKVPVGVDSTQTEFATVEQIGGEKEHTLTLNEMPNHRHERIRQVINNQYYGSDIGTHENVIGGACNTGGYNVDDMTNNNAVTGYTGGGESHNNLQPYITCYMWKRIV